MTGLDGVRSLTDAVPGQLADAAPVVTVIGDVMLDGWWTGRIERFCREAPAPVVDITRRDYAPGGAANTAMNLAALGARVRIVGLVGNDDAGTSLRRLLVEAGVDTTGLIGFEGVRTATKYRIIGGDQVMLRLDDSTPEPPAAAVAELAAAVLPALVPAGGQGDGDGQAGTAAAATSAVVVCDYGSGALAGPVRAALSAALVVAAGCLPDNRRPLTVIDAHDPRPWAQLKPDLATPNARECGALLGVRFESATDRTALARAHGPALLGVTGSAAVVVTLDRDGTVLLGEDGGSHRTWARPATEKQASGAGDTFVACLTLARAAGLPLTTSLDLAQAAADVVVRRFGTSVCSTADLAAHLGSFADTALEAAELEIRIAAERAEGRRIVLTNGCFDVLHRGHTRYLNQAKQLGDVLVVALNSDDSVRRLKGADRPINSVGDRAGVIAALTCVDYVTVFDADTPIALIEALRPDVYAKGGDYSPDMLAETPVVQACGGTVRILDYVPEHSTTAVMRRIRGVPGGVPGGAGGGADGDLENVGSAGGVEGAHAEGAHGT